MDEPVVQLAVLFILTLSRLGGMLVFAPILGGAIVPVRVRVMLVLVLGAAVLPAVGMSGTDVETTGDVASLLPIVAGETLAGLVVGLVALLPIAAAELGGLIAGQQLGLGLSSIYNPALDAESTVPGQLLMMVALTIFVSLGGLESALGAVMNSFVAVPPGTVSLAVVPLDRIVPIISSGFELAVRVTAPVIGIIMLETVATAIASKTMPAINILSIGFAVKIVLGLSAMLLAMEPIGGVFVEHVHETIQWMTQWGQTPVA